MRWERFALFSFVKGFNNDDILHCLTKNDNNFIDIIRIEDHHQRELSLANFLLLVGVEDGVVTCSDWYYILYF